MMGRKKWTVLVWMAGDNNLDAAGLADLAEMKTVGSTDHVDVVAQFDRMGEGGTRRYYLTRGGELDDDRVEELGETNTGNPAVAMDFFRSGIQMYPSEKVLAVIWNHGSGIDEEDVYAGVRAMGKAVSRSAVRGAGEISREHARQIVASDFKRALFSTTIERAVADRGIGYDDTSRDFLDNAELKRVIAPLGKIDVLGLDACLMSLVEVAYQLRGNVDTLVASEEEEPNNGWPYGAVLQMLSTDPEILPAAAAARIVQLYVDSYGEGENVTQSALDLSRLERVAKAIDRLAAAGMSALDTAQGYGELSMAILSAQRFHKKDYVDLGDLCNRLSTYSSDADVKEAADAVRAVVLDDNALVVAAAKRGPAVARATGVAIYLPVVGDVKVPYDELDFSGDTRWGEFITKYRTLPG